MESTTDRGSTLQTGRLPEDQVKAFVRELARLTPELSSLSSEDLVRLGRVVTAEALRDDLKRRVKLEHIDYQGERGRFLARSRSPHTARAYQAALSSLDAFTALQGIAPLELDAALADDWINEMKAQGRAPATVRLVVSGASAFWTWLERRHPELRNPFRGTRERPARKATRPLAVPSAEEVKTILTKADPVLRAAVSIMAAIGLRVGALPGLSIHGERFTTTTKGKEQSGQVPLGVRKDIERAGLPLRAPFAGLTADQLAHRFAYLVKKLHAAGKLSARYSVHDLRHHFAVRLYGEGHDIYQLELRLGHASIQVTESYLRSLGLV